ncbi:bactofilin family protein [Peribacillus kribbensis]|uniref:bactofilin family protein n=1 Tax=Peribacillus kribbensis TaxID=356658 RepID=UPI00042934B2|nr:polymer-forming cytoskeletal protein [Peribacillus kribbensis]
MVTETKYPLKINGSMTVPGGSFTDVHVNGSGKITSDVNCDSFHINGHSSVLGNIKAAGEITINGKADIKGSVKADEIEVNGKAEVKGALEAGDIKVNGNLKLFGNVTAEDFVSKGKTVIEGNCEAEDFVSRGTIHISELLNADSIDIKLIDDSFIKEMGGEEIEVRRDSSAPILGRLLSLLGSSKSCMLTSDSIEGDQIYLEYTSAGTVRGNDVRIGPGCNIGRLEYKNEMSVDPSSEVKEAVQN